MSTASSETKRDWREIAAEKRAQILAAIPKEWHLKSVPSPEEQRDVTGAYIKQFLSKDEIEITELDAVDIVAKTTSGERTAVQVTKAFCHRAGVAHQLVKCLHEVFFEAALRDAEELDRYLKKHGKPKGPLHGLPVSLKDQFHVKDVDTSMGYIGWIGNFEGNKEDPRYRTYESELVKELRALGAVLYVKTSVPHTLMCGETVNNIIEYTQNPKNRLLSSGGSSGGEGALIALKGSPLGFGTDIGGSIRIPAAFNGLFGLRPTSGRLPYQGMANSMDGQNTILSVAGPLSGSLRSLNLAVKSVLSTEPWQHDPLTVPMPWRPEEQQLPSKLSFGVLRHNGKLGLTEPVHRALETAVDALKTAGHEVIEWTPDPPQSTLEQILNEAWGLDGNKNLNDAMDLAGEPMAPQIGIAFGKRKPQKNATEVSALNKRRREANKAYMKYWNSTAGQTATGRPVDAVLSPVAPFPVAKPECFFSYAYTTWVNTTDYSSVVVPITHCDAAIDKKNESYKPLNDTDKKCQDSYDPKLFHGAPVSIQVVGRKYQEERTLALAEVLHNALRTAPATTKVSSSQSKL